MEPEIQSILEANEQVVWTWKQDVKTTITFSALVFIIAIMIGRFFSGIESASCTINGKPGTPEQCSAVLNYIGTGSYIAAILIPLILLLSYKATVYLVTNKRAIIKSGIIGADIRSIYYEQVKSVLVDVWLLGKIFGTGSIMMDTGRIKATKNGTSIDYDRFSNILRPYDVYRLIQEGLSSRREQLHSGRADFENAQNGEYKEFVQQVEKWKQEV